MSVMAPILFLASTTIVGAAVAIGAKEKSVVAFGVAALFGANAVLLFVREAARHGGVNAAGVAAGCCGFAFAVVAFIVTAMLARDTST